MVRLWDPVNGQQTGTLHGMTETVTEVAFTCDVKYVLASGADQAVRMWDLSSGRVRHTLTGHSQKARSCSLSSICMGYWLLPYRGCDDLSMLMCIHAGGVCIRHACVKSHVNDMV